MSDTTQTNRNLTRREKVFETCDLLYKENRTVTKTKVRELSGGSSSDVGPFVDEWMALNNTLKDAKVEILTPALLRELDNLLKQASLKAEHTYNLKLSSQTALAEELEIKLQACEKELELTQHKLNESLNYTAGIEKELSQAAMTLQSTKQQLAVVTSDKEMLVTDKQNLRAELEKLRDEHQKHIHSVEQKADQRVTTEVGRVTKIFEANENRLHTQIDKMRTDLKEADNQHASEQKTLNSQILELKQESAAHAKEADIIRGIADNLGKKNQVLEQKIDRLNDEFTARQDAMAELKLTNEKLTIENQRLEQIVSNINTEES